MVKLIAHQLKMQFADRVLFSAPQLQFGQGDVIYLQGDNGSGKSTLMKIFAGLQAPSSGHISAHGFIPSPWWRRNPLLAKAVYLHQHPYLFEGDVNYNLHYGLHFHHLSKPALVKRVDTAIEMAQLAHLMKSNASDLSGGERQRLAIARAWVMQPQLLMLDEPISNMDQESRHLVMNMIQQLKQQGTGMLISSHQTCALTAMCQQHWHIEQQQIKVTVPTRTSTSQEHLYVIAN